jgi:hypothetical protein
MRRAELTTILITVFVVALVMAAALGVRTAPNRGLLDSRRTTFSSGPEGAMAFAEALEDLGVPIERRRRALYGFARDSEEVDSDVWLAVLGLVPQRVETGSLFANASFPSEAEVREVMRYLARGGALLLAGESGFEECLGFQVERLRRDGGTEREVLPPPGAPALPRAEYVWSAIGTDEEEGMIGLDPADCDAPPITSSRLLLSTREGRPISWRHSLDGGGRVIMLADSRYLSNRFLKETGSGPVVIGWLLDEEPTRVVVDEFHQGFVQGGSLFRAAWSWMIASPGGWALLQLALASVIALAAAAVRFGPALNVIERRRRSALEHLDALAVGLERAGGDEEAVNLIVEGLRRRLSRSGSAPRVQGRDVSAWLDSLALAARSREARESVARLGRIMRERDGDERVLAAATAVEEVWEALRPTNRFGTS